MKVHGIVCTYLGDGEYDIGKTAAWLNSYVNTLFFYDLNYGEAGRKYMVDYAKTFPDAKFAYHPATSKGFYEDAPLFRQMAFQAALAAWGYADGDWVVLIDASESVTNNKAFDQQTLDTEWPTLINTLLAEARSGTNAVKMPFYVFLQQGAITENFMSADAALGNRLVEQIESLEDQLSAVVPGTGVTPPSYLSATATAPARAVYTADAANLNITADTTWVAKIRLGSMTDPAQRTIACKRPAPSSNLSWQLSQTANVISLQVSVNGTTFTYPLTGPAMPGVAGDTITIAASLRMNNGTGGHTLSYRWLNGSTWTLLDSVNVAGTLATLFDSSTQLTIGGVSNYTSNYENFIYWVEQRTGLDPAAGTVVWRFDPAEHTTGTSYTDPRGRLWAQAVSGSIVHPAAIPPVYVVSDPAERAALQVELDALLLLQETNDSVLYWTNDPHYMTGTRALDRMFNVGYAKTLATAAWNRLDTFAAASGGAAAIASIVSYSYARYGEGPPPWTVDTDGGFANRKLIQGVRTVGLPETYATADPVGVSHPVGTQSPAYAYLYSQYDTGDGDPDFNKYVALWRQNPRDGVWYVNHELGPVPTDPLTGDPSVDPDDWSNQPTSTTGPAGTGRP